MGRAVCWASGCGPVENSIAGLQFKTPRRCGDLLPYPTRAALGSLGRPGNPTTDLRWGWGAILRKLGRTSGYEPSSPQSQGRSQTLLRPRLRHPDPKGQDSAVPEYSGASVLYFCRFQQE